MRNGLSVVMWSFMVSVPALGNFLPPNDLHLEDHLFTESGITEEEFNEVLDKVEAVYTDIVSDAGGKLRMNRYWTSSTVNASASQSFGRWNVNMYGGLARREEITVDGFTMVVCHELGHHLAGFPRVSRWAANEGQSDYFAAQSCSELLWKDEPRKNRRAKSEIDDIAQDYCERNFRKEGSERIHLCYRQMAANHSIASLLGALRSQTIGWDTPDENVVERTSHSHPAAQCRLDTYMAGTLCQKEFDLHMIPGNEKEAASTSCHQANGDLVGLRPRCWFKPGIESL